MDSFSTRLYRLAVQIGPLLFAVLLCVLSAAPLHVPHAGQLGFGMALISVFYWTVHAPALMPPAAVFLIGMTNDALGGAPFGLGTLVLLVSHALAMSHRRSFDHAGFLGVWLGFALLSAIASGLLWAATCLLSFSLLDPAPELLACGVTLALYPALAHLFARAQRSWLRAV